MIDDSQVEPGEGDWYTTPPEAGQPVWARRNRIASNMFSVTTAIYNSHDATVAQLQVLIGEQRRTNQLLEWLGQVIAATGQPGATPDKP